MRSAADFFTRPLPGFGEVMHVVELLQFGEWRAQMGRPEVRCFPIAELANQRADVLREMGFTARVRPVPIPRSAR